MKKPLPSIASPSLIVELPISKQKVKYRPFVIKEQKALLLAQESKDVDSIIETIKSVISSCSDNTLDFSKTPTVDLIYFFLQLRIASVGPEVQFRTLCTECNHPSNINMSLNDIKVNTDNIIKDIKLTDTVGIIFRFPTIEDAFDIVNYQDRSLQMLYRLIDKVYDEDSVYDKTDYTEKEFIDWIESLNDKQLKAIEVFAKNIPTLSHKLDFNCPQCNAKQSRTLEGLHNFFRFGSDS